MKLLTFIHLLFVVFFLSIPFWPKKYLEYGLYFPIGLATIWIIFNGCPLTFLQKELNDEYFSQILLRPIFPKISKENTTRATYYILILVSFIAALRLKC